MIFEFSHYCFILSTVLALLAVAYPTHLQKRLSYINGALLACSLSGLIHAFIISDFSVEVVALHSHVHSPLLYKICGVWANTQGSMLLWLVCLQFWLMLFARSSTNQNLKNTALRFLWLIQAGLSLYCLLFNNPFHRLMPFPLEGNDLNPVLQDKALMYHPPLLYLGYTGFLLIAAFSTAMMVHKNLELGALGRWNMAAFGFLTLGITAGSWWAYDELGWGGFWFWDPVESLSLLPWIASNALLHTNKRPNKWAPLWGILAGTSVALNIVLVRGGILTSVHSFAKDPYSLIILSALCIGLLLPAFFVYARNAKIFPSFPWFSYAGLNSLGMAAAWVIVLIGVLAPLGSEVFGYKLQLTSIYYTIFLTPIFSGILIGMAYFMPKPFIDRLTPSAWFIVLGHLGYFCLFSGVMINALWQKEVQKVLCIGESLQLKHYNLQLQDIQMIPSSNHMRIQGKMLLTHKSTNKFLYPERHYYFVPQQMTTQSALWRKGPTLICAILGEQYDSNQWLVKMYYNRGILWVFFGGLLIGLTALAGALRPRFKSGVLR